MGENKEPEKGDIVEKCPRTTDRSENDRKHYLRNLEKIKKQRNNYYYENRDKILEKARNKRAKNAEINHKRGRPPKYTDPAKPICMNEKILIDSSLS